jgi:hypothetical protein
MNELQKKERTSRIIARGEFSNHCHVVTGEGVQVLNEDGETTIMIEESATDVKLRHLLESAWHFEQEQWTGEHQDINLLDPIIEVGKGVRHGDVYLKKISSNTYKYIPQIEKDPFEDIIRQVKD